ncbi:MAG TPA: alpha/beta fold hydrolase [Pseudolysinimonas sp.]|nr:alpha/beta fold hydrolase [Pseudolysinimonas sp.]
MSVRDSEQAQIAIKALDLARRGEFAAVLAMFAPAPQRRLTAATIDSAWQSNVGRHGAIWSLEPSGIHSDSGLTEVSVLLRTTSTDLQSVVSMDRRGRLLNLQVTPLAVPWRHPDYADPGSFDEFDVALGDRPLVVGGTVSLPRASGEASGRVSAVVLLGSGGPFDRDMTMGNNRIGKDLAWGLASRGIAVLRFDKPTHAHADRIARDGGMTPTDEYLPFGAAAVDVLRGHPSVDASRIVIVGHSMGGSYAARVAAARPEVSGLVLLAADAQPMHRAAVRVMNHLASLDPASPALRSAAAAMEALAANVDSPQLSRRTDPRTLPFGHSGAYWLDVRGYDPVRTAAEVGRPLLILQGGRDYQVTVDDDLALWRAAFGGRDDVSFRVYDADDHLFFAGSGPSTPAGYEPRQHVDEAVIADIADWIARPRAGAAAD